MHIWGAGLSGLIASAIFPQAKIFEARQRDEMTGHKALLRFRSTAVADAVGIEFRKVRVQKGLWSKGEFAQPSIMHANHYSMKVAGRLLDRSVWNLDAVDRWIAPEDLVDQLVERAGNRIAWGEPGTLWAAKRSPFPVISTIPMDVLAKMTGRAPEFEFERAGITVRRWRIHGADVYQTVYVSDPSTSCYRVSITGDLLIAEFIGHEIIDDFNVFEPFGIEAWRAQEIDTTRQAFGKIAPINEAWRRFFILGASQDNNVFSLGRFATWRNILLDDIVHDCSVIKRLIGADGYARSAHSARTR